MTEENKKKLSKDRKERIKELINWMQATKDTPRRVSLSHFAEKKNLNYDTVKKDARALSYASKTGPKGYDLRFVPKKYKKDVEKLWNEFEKKEESRKRRFKQGGEIDINEARKASNTFLKHHPEEDVERLKELCIDEVSDQARREVEKKADLMAKHLVEKEEKKAKTGVHPAKIYSQVWGGEAGKKIHKEIEEKLKELKDAPQRKKDQVIKKMWEANLQKVRAAKYYEEFRNEYLKQLKELGTTQKVSKELKAQKPPRWMKEWVAEREGKKAKEIKAKEVWQRLINDYKNLRKYNKPGKPAKIPKELKESVKNIEKFRQHLSEKEKREKFMRALKDQSQNIKLGDEWYSLAKKKEKAMKEKLEEQKKKEKQKKQKEKEKQRRK